MKPAGGGGTGHDPRSGGGIWGGGGGAREVGGAAGIWTDFCPGAEPLAPVARGAVGQVRGHPPPPPPPPATQPRDDLLEEKRGSGLVPYHPVAEALFRMVSW